MKKNIRGIVLIIIAILAMTASAFSVVSLGLEMINNFSDNIDSSGISLIAENGIDLIFSIIEISFGVKLIKAVVNDDRFETYKMTSGLVTTIIMSLFTVFIVKIVFAFVFKNPIENLDMVQVVIYVAIILNISFMRPIILRRKLLALDIIMFISSLLSLVVYIMNFDFSKELSNEFVSNVINCLMLLLLVIFSFGSFIFYMKNPEACLIEEREHEDIDILETYEKYEKVKLYSFRGVDNSKTKIAITLSIVGSLFGIVFSILYFLEKGFYEDFSEKINSFIGLFSGELTSSPYNLVFFFLEIMIPLLAMSYSVNYLFGIITNNAQYKIYNIYIMKVGSVFLTGVISAKILSIGWSFASQNFSISMLSFSDTILVIVIIISSIVTRTYKNTLRNITEGIKNGDTYHEHLGKIVSMNLFNGLIGILSIIVCIYEDYLSSGIITYSAILLVLSILLIVVGGFIEKKNPASEYLIIKRRI